MLIKSGFDVAQPVDKVWQFFDDIAGVVGVVLPAVLGVLLDQILGVEVLDGAVPFAGLRDCPGATAIEGVEAEIITVKPQIGWCGINPLSECQCASAMMSGSERELSF
jgi:hypothetical protein